MRIELETNKKSRKSGDKEKIRKKWRQPNNGDKKETGKLELTPLP